MLTLVDSQAKKLGRAVQEKLPKVRNDGAEDNKLAQFESIDVLMEK